MVWGGVIAYRERGRPDGTSREVPLLRRLAPRLGQGLHAAALSGYLGSPLKTSAEVGFEPGVLVLDPRGRVEQCTPAAERWLRALVG